MSKTETKPASEPESIDFAEIEARLRPLSTEKLHFHFADCFRKAAKFLAEAAVCVKLCKERGESLRDFRNAPTYLGIAEGRVDPEAVWKFIESPNRKLIEALPLSDQKRLAADAMVPVVEPKASGGYDVRMVDLVKAPVAVARQVIGGGLVLNPEEQLANLHTRKPRKAIAAKVSVEPVNKRVVVFFAASEEAALVEAANRAGRSVADLIRDIVLGSGKLK